MPERDTSEAHAVRADDRIKLMALHINHWTQDDQWDALHAIEDLIKYLETVEPAVADAIRYGLSVHRLSLKPNGEVSPRTSYVINYPPEHTKGT